jgi:hypothetical protein
MKNAPKSAEDLVLFLGIIYDTYRSGAIRIDGKPSEEGTKMAAHALTMLDEYGLEIVPRFATPPMLKSLKEHLEMGRPKGDPLPGMWLALMAGNPLRPPLPDHHNVVSMR